MSNIIPMTTTPGEKSALEEFLPEVTLSPEHPLVDRSAMIDPADLRLDPIGPQSGQENASDVQMWPMMAAACVALGVSLLALALFSKLGQF